MWEHKEENKPVCVKNCGKRNEEKELVYIDYYVMAKVNHLMQKYPNLEWLAYLIGKDNIVEDMYIPEQKVTNASVTEIKGKPEIGIIGVIHSHHNLGLHSFSGTDHAYINDNHDLSILVWNTGINGQKRIKLECGATMVVPIEIKCFHPELNTAEWDKEADENISEKRYTFDAHGVVGYDPGYSFNPPVTTKTYNHAEKKTEENKSGDTNCEPTPWDAYLDQLVYDNEIMDTKNQEDYELDQDEIEAHFRRIEERECPKFVAAGVDMKKNGVGPWEV